MYTPLSSGIAVIAIYGAEHDADMGTLDGATRALQYPTLVELASMYSRIRQPRVNRWRGAL
jgi:hypothetical protein